MWPPPRSILERKQGGKEKEKEKRAPKELPHEGGGERFPREKHQKKEKSDEQRGHREREQEEREGTVERDGKLSCGRFEQFWGSQ